MTFKNDIEKFVKRVERRAKITVTGATADLAGAIVKKTPVDSPVGPSGETPVWFDPGSVGEARGGWSGSVNSNLPQTSRVLDPVGDQTIQKIALQFQSYNPKTDSALWLSNTVGYIGILEFGGYTPQNGYNFRNRLKSTTSGFSFQAPNGMMRVNTRNWKSFVAQALSRARR